jgi:hypothetical protein
MKPFTVRSLGVVGAIVLGVACSGSPVEVDPPGTTKPPADLAIIKVPTTAPALFNDSVSFYAKVGQDAEGFIYYLGAAGGRGEKFARLRIRQRSLLARPDGTPFGANDSVLITMKMTNPRELLVELSPSGLKFNTSDPAELRLEYAVTGGDLNGDGKSDNDDNQIETKLSIWRQEKAGDPFVKIGSVKTEGLRELKADLTSFSRYAIAY